MATKQIDDSILYNIAASIRSKNNVSTTYKPSEMAAAIDAIPPGYPEPTGSVNIGANGTVNVKDYASAVVNVPNSYAASDEGKVVDNGSLVAQTSKSITENGTHDTTKNNQVVVNVPNSYSASDEGKVVDDGALIAQGSQTITENGTYDTTLISSLTANVSGGGGGETNVKTEGDAYSVDSCIASIEGAVPDYIGTVFKEYDSGIPYADDSALSLLSSDMIAAGFCYLSKAIGDEARDSSGRHATRLTNEPVIFINLGKAASGGSGSSYGALSVQPFICNSADTYGGFKVCGKLTTPSEKTLFVFRMNGTWDSKRNEQYTIDGTQYTLNTGTSPLLKYTSNAEAEVEFLNFTDEQIAQLYSFIDRMFAQGE